MPNSRANFNGRKVLVVDDEVDIRHVVRHTLEDAGFEVVTAGSMSEALEVIRGQGLPHLAVVDIRMPGGSGLELCAAVHRFSDLPIIMLTAIDSEDTVIATIEQHAEDYITKPFNPRELAARVRRVMRRVGDFAYALAPTIRIDNGLSVDLANRSARVGGEEVHLTPTETRLLHVLMRHAGRSLSPDFLLGRVWPAQEVFEDTLRVHLHRLRNKLEPQPERPRYLITVRGEGYSFPAPQS